jgi:DNA-directed RNA polymerase specialized sigma24 family protein
VPIGDVMAQKFSFPHGQSWDNTSINHAIEDVFLSLRSAKQAEKELAGELPQRGAIAMFPVAVFAPGLNAKKSIRPYPLRIDVEPGAVLEQGTHAVHVVAKVKESKIKGKFFVVVSGTEPSEIPSAVWEIKNEKGKKIEDAEIKGLPESIWVRSVPRVQLRRELRKMVHRKEYAYAELYKLSMPTMRAALQKYQSALFHQSASLDMNDILQECWLRHLQRIETYASPQRPDATWRQVLVVNTRRDGGRELRRNPNKISDQVAQLVGVIRNNPHLHTAEEIQEHVTITKEVAKIHKENPKRSKQVIEKEVQKLWNQGKLEPKVSLRVAENAFLAAPFENTISLSAPVSSEHDMSQDDFLADPLSAEGHISEFELEEQLKEVRLIVELLFPEQADQFLLAMGLSPSGYNYKEEEIITPGDARRQFLRKFKLRQNNSDIETIRDKAAKILLDEDGDLRSAEELKEKFASLKKKGLLT